MVVVVIIILYVYLKYLVINNYSGNNMWLYMKEYLIILLYIILNVGDLIKCIDELFLMYGG